MTMHKGKQMLLFSINNTNTIIQLPELSSLIHTKKMTAKVVQTQLNFLDNFEKNRQHNNT